MEEYLQTFIYLKTLHERHAVSKLSLVNARPTRKTLAGPILEKTLYIYIFVGHTGYQ